MWSIYPAECGQVVRYMQNGLTLLKNLELNCRLKVEIKWLSGIIIIHVCFSSIG